MGKSDKKRAKIDILYTLRKQYDNFLEEEKQRKARNEYILGSLGKIWRSASSATRRHQPVIAPENIFKTNLDYARKREDNQYPTRDVAILPMTTADKFINEQLILAEISKKYILIPKIEANSIVNQPASVTLEENYNLVDNDNNWKAKYDILKDLVKPHDNIQTQEETTIEKNSKVELNNVNLKEAGFPLQNKELPERDIPLRNLQEFETHVSNQRRNSRSLTFVTKPNEKEFVNETNDKFQFDQPLKKVGGEKYDTVSTPESSETSNYRKNSQPFYTSEFPGHYKEDNQEDNASNVSKMPFEDHSIGYNTVERKLSEIKLADQTNLSSTEQTNPQPQSDTYDIENVEPENNQEMENDSQNQNGEQNYDQLYRSDPQPDEYLGSRIEPENNSYVQLSDQNPTVSYTEQNYQQSYENNTLPENNFLTNEGPEQFNGMQLVEKNTPISYTEQNYEQPFEYDPQTDNYVVTEQGVDHVENPHKLISNAENIVRQIDYQYSAHENEPVLSQQHYDENNYYNQPVKTDENVFNVLPAEATYPQDYATVNPAAYAEGSTANENYTNVTESPLNIEEAIQEFNQENQEMFYSEQTNYQEGNEVVQQEYQHDSQDPHQYYEDHQQGQQYTAEYVDNDITQQQYDPNYAEQYQGYNQEQTYVQEPVQYEQINYDTTIQNEPEQENPKEEVLQQLDVEEGYVGNEAQPIKK